MGCKMKIENIMNRLVEDFGEDIDKIMDMSEEDARALFNDLRNPKVGDEAMAILESTVEDNAETIENELSEPLVEHEEQKPADKENILSNVPVASDYIIIEKPSDECDSTPSKEDIMDRFNEDEVGELEGNKYVKIIGLRRVATELIGPICSQSVQVMPITIDNYNGVSVIMSITFCCANTNFLKDNDLVTVKFSDAADCIPGFNSDIEEFGKYPTALATTRAEARIYRKALGLNIVSYEEISNIVPESFGVKDGSLTTTQKKVIESICKSKGLVLSDIIKKYDKTKETLNDFSHKEGIDFVGHLNRKKEAKK